MIFSEVIFLRGKAGFIANDVADDGVVDGLEGEEQALDDGGYEGATKSGEGEAKKRIPS